MLALAPMSDARCDGQAGEAAYHDYAAHCE